MPSVILPIDPHELLGRNCVTVTQFLPQEYAVKIIGCEAKQKQGAPCGRTLPKATYDSDMYNREFPSGNFLFFVVCMMSLLRLPCSKLSLAFLAVPAGKDGRVERPRQTVDDFIGIRGSVCGLFLFVQTHAPLIVPPWQSRARKSKFQFHIRRKGADAFRPALAAGGSLMAYKCLSLCDFFVVQHFFKLCHIRFVLLEDF